MTTYIVVYILFKFQSLPKAGAQMLIQSWIFSWYCTDKVIDSPDDRLRATVERGTCFMLHCVWIHCWWKVMEILQLIPSLTHLIQLSKTSERDYGTINVFPRNNAPNIPTRKHKPSMQTWKPQLAAFTKQHQAWPWHHGSRGSYDPYLII